MRAFDNDHKQLWAEFHVEVSGRAGASHRVVFESRHGKIGTPKAKNPDYMRALEVVLRRLGLLRAALVDAQVVSKRTVGLTDAERRLHLTRGAYPLALSSQIDPQDLALDLAKAQRAAGQPGAVPHPKPKMGALKRIALDVAIPGAGDLPPDHLADILAGTVLDTEAVDPTDFEDAIDVDLPEELDRAVAGKARAEQHLLRAHLFGTATHAQCALCGRELPVDLLRAAHIKPRAHCSRAERLDFSHVAMPACVLGCDTLFELGYIGVDKAGTIRVRDGEPAELGGALEVLRALDGRPVTVHSEGTAGYFGWHWGVRFGGS